MSPRVALVLALVFVAGFLAGITSHAHMISRAPPPSPSPPPTPLSPPVEICPSQSPLYLSALETLFDARDVEPLDLDTMQSLHNTSQSVHGRQFLRAALAPARKTQLVAFASAVAASPCIRLLHVHRVVECSGQRIHVLSIGPRADAPSPSCSAPCTGPPHACDVVAQLARSVRAQTTRCTEPPSAYLLDSVPAGAQGKVECAMAEPSGTVYLMRSE